MTEDDDEYWIELRRTAHLEDPSMWPTTSPWPATNDTDDDTRWRWADR